MICMNYDHNKKFGLLKCYSGYGKFNLNSPKGYSLKIINAQTDTYHPRPHTARRCPAVTPSGHFRPTAAEAARPHTAPARDPGRQTAPFASWRSQGFM